MPLALETNFKSNKINWTLPYPVLRKVIYFCHLLTQLTVM